MSLLVLEGVGVAFGGRTLIDQLSLRIGEEDRIGLVGRNGAGKSSLFRLVAGVMEANVGVVRRSGGLRIGYLAQELDRAGGRPLLDSVLTSVPGKDDLERMLEEVEEQLASADEEDEQIALAQKLADLHEDLAHFDAAYSKHEALRILAGLGFDDADMQRDVGELSGGWHMRSVLAGLLFQRPDLLLLDEPTNHLDVPTVAWLGAFLRRYRGAFMLVCHDRTFLNEQISRVVSFEPEGVRQYSGDYEAYLAARAEELAVIERRAANVARERDAAERFIRRFRAQATKARAVQSRIKALDRMEEFVAPTSDRSLTFRFPPCPRAGQDVVRLAGVGHSYGDNHVFSDAKLTARRGERIAIVGANGNGKTTLLKIMAGQLTATRGTATLGHNVRVGYYAQHVTEQLDTRATIFDEVWRASAADDVTMVRTALGTMLFSGDDVDKSIGVLSGGEKARVALAKLLVNPGNMILMDEPTNHLDLDSSEALARALETFEGTLMFVSHNRSFVERLGSKIWDVSAGRVEEFSGTFSEYMDHCARLARGAAEVAEPVARAEPAGSGKPTVSKRQQKRAGSADAASAQVAPAAKRSAQPRKPMNSNAGRALARKVADTEKRITALEQAQSERSGELSLPETYADQERYNAILDAYRSDAAKLEELMIRWERTNAELAALEAG